MSDKMAGKVAIVTGAASGMGEHHARLLAAHGAKVVLTDIQADLGTKIAEEIGENAVFMQHDVSSEEQWQQVVTDTESKFGTINVLINNAAIASGVAFEDITVEIMNRYLAVNTVGVFLGMKAVLPSMKRAGGGSIVNISSVSGIRGAPNALPYTASKFAVTGMTKTAAVDLGKYNIRVNSIHPGTVLTPLLLANPEYIDHAVGRIPLGRGARADELSGLALFLASDDSSYCTGAEFVADGGLTCQQ